MLFTPEVEVVHQRGRSAAAAPAETRAAYRRSQIAFYEKHHPYWAPLLRLYLRSAPAKSLRQAHELAWHCALRRAVGDARLRAREIRPRASLNVQDVGAERPKT